MHIQGTHKTIEYTLDVIVAKGGDALYNTYLNQKLPNHANNSMQTIISRHFNTPFSNIPHKSTISKEIKPTHLQFDNITPAKVIKARPTSQMDKNSPNKIYSTSRQPIKANKSLLQKSTKGTGAKPNICFKNECAKNVEETSLKEQQLWAKKKQEGVEDQKKLAQENRKLQQRSYRRRELENKIEELAVQGIHYGYDDNGDIIAPSPEEIKASKKKKPRKNNQILEMKFKTLDVGVARFNPEESCTVSGRKRGFTTSKFYKKQRLTNEEYNNQNRRQFTTIPYVNIEDGVRIIEKDKNIIAEKNKQSPMTRESFVKETSSNFFKSFMPDSEQVALSLCSISERPNTTGQWNRTKGTAETGLGRSMRKSILWRPQTTSKTCRVNVNNRQLAQDFINS